MHKRFFLPLVMGLLWGCGDTFVSSENGTGAKGGEGGSSGGVAGKSGAAGAETNGGAAGSGASGGSKATGGSGPACAKLKDTPCDDCEVAACEEAYCKCAGSKECRDLIACYAMSMMQPPPAAYIEYCNFQNDDGISEAGLLGACSMQQCDSVCDRPGTDKCGACLYAKCPTPVNACFGDSACVKYVNCYKDCDNDAVCQDKCGADHPIGLKKAIDVAMCEKANCDSECP